MTDVNVMLSVERKLEAAAAESTVKFAPDSYKLGYCESMLTNVLHQVYSQFGEDAMLKLMENVGINPVYCR